MRLKEHERRQCIKTVAAISAEFGAKSPPIRNQAHSLIELLKSNRHDPKAKDDQAMRQHETLLALRAEVVRSTLPTVRYEPIGRRPKDRP